MILAPDASLNDGMFDVVLVAQASKYEFVRQLPKVFKGTHLESPFVRIIRARDVEVSCDRPFTTYADGDPVAVLPAHFTVLPAALHVMVPQTSAVTP